MSQAFLKPRLVGPRFEDHSLPLSFLKDLATLEEMVVEVAKWKWKKDHPDRDRVPRSFSQGLELKLTHVDEGSAIPVIALAGSLLSSNPNAEDIRYFELGRDAIVETVSQAEQGNSSYTLPPKLLGYFDRLGRSLRDGESMEFSPVMGGTPVKLTSMVRNRLIAASRVEEWTEEMQVRGSISGVDQKTKTFVVRLQDGTELKAPLDPQHSEIVLSALAGYDDGFRVLVQGSVKTDHQDRLKSIEAVEHISELDDLDVGARLDELSTLREGWLDGKGKALEKTGLKWLTKSFDQWFALDVDLPYLYPTAEGMVRAEWNVGRWDISLEIDLDQKSGEWHALHLDQMTEQEQVLNLKDASDWKALGDKLRQLKQGVV